jgi:uncharacterized protein DUF5681
MTDNEIPRRPRSRIPRNKGAAYEIGYGKPPCEHQFQPGQSGNLRGRPRGVQNTATFLQDVLSRKIPMRWQGREQSISVRKAIYLRVVNDALAGSLKATAFLLERFAPQMSPAQEQVYRTADEIKEELKRRGTWGMLHMVMERDADEQVEAGPAERLPRPMNMNDSGKKTFS